jgi:hypothetical protein
MMRCARTGKWTCTSARLWSESSNLTQQTPVTVLATETQVTMSLPADRVTNQGKRSRTRKPSVPKSKRPQRPPCNLPADVRLDSERLPRRGGWRILSASVRESRAKRPLRAPGTGIASHKPRVGGRGAPRLQRIRAECGRGSRHVVSFLEPAQRAGLITIGMSRQRRCSSRGPGRLPRYERTHRPRSDLHERVSTVRICLILEYSAAEWNWPIGHKRTTHDRGSCSTVHKCTNRQRTLFGM